MWFLLAFISAILGAVDVILNKKCLEKMSAAVLTWALFAFSIPGLAIFALKNGVPALNYLFFIGVIGSALTFVFSKTITNETLKNNQISQVFPLTAFSGLFVYVLGLIFMGESLRPIPILGLFSIVLGSYILNADKSNGDLLRPFKVLFNNKASLLFLLAIFLNSVTTIFDKTAILNSIPNNSAFVLLAENLCMAIMLSVYLYKKEKVTWMREIKENISMLLLTCTIYTFVSLLVMNAFIEGPVALVMAIKRLQIFFILILGYIFFHDKPTRHAWVASAVMIIGVLLIRLG